MFSCNKCNNTENLCAIIDDNVGQDNYSYQTTFDENIEIICKPCLETEDEEDYFVEQCGVCKLYFQECLHFMCTECEKDVCSMACLSVTGCQTRNCICKTCFKTSYIAGKCIACKQNDIKLDDIYLYDCDPSPYCSNC